jgi:hypothetical protein
MGAVEDDGCAVAGLAGAGPGGQVCLADLDPVGVGKPAGAVDGPDPAALGDQLAHQRAADAAARAQDDMQVR